MPLTFDQNDFPGFTTLAGTSIDSIVRLRKHAFRENILFTHWGLSGPAILQISLYWNPGETISINLLPDRDAEAWLIELKDSSPKSTVISCLKRVFPVRFAQAYAEHYCDTGQKPLAEIGNKQLRKLGRRINDWQVRPNGTQGYKKAEVTRGG